MEIRKKFIDRKDVVFRKASYGDNWYYFEHAPLDDDSVYGCWGHVRIDLSTKVSRGDGYITPDFVDSEVCGVDFSFDFVWFKGDYNVGVGDVDPEYVSEVICYIKENVFDI